jgi:hypothetical protein
MEFTSTMRFSDYFDKTYIINLPERRDRKRAMKREVKKLGMPIVGANIEVFPAIKPSRRDGFPSIGARGCFLSHLSILKKAKGNNLNSLLVMEDDLSISPLLATEQEKLLRTLSESHWHFAYFGHALETEFPVFPEKAILRRFDGPIMLAHFYAVNGAILDRLIAFLEAILTRPEGHPDGGPMHVDGAYSMFRQVNPDVKTLVALPSLGRQRSSRSDIYPNRWYDKWSGARELVGQVRKAKELLITYR